MIKSIACFVICLVLISACGQKNQKVDNLKVFAKAVGYVQYFHPSDEAASLNWDKFTTYGAKRIEQCSSNEELVNTLNQLFNPIAPSVKFAAEGENTAYDLGHITPQDTSGYEIIYWQHRGFGKGIQRLHDSYKSVRVKGGVNAQSTQLFDCPLSFGTVITKELGNQIYCQVPLVLYSNEKGTYPKADSLQLQQLNSFLINIFNEKVDLPLWLGNVISTYNVFQHFYPYFDVVDVDWDKELGKALSRCFEDKTPRDHLITLQKFMAPLKDGHIRVRSNSIFYSASPIEWEWIEDQLVITKVFDKSLPIQVGDVVTHVDGKTSKEFFEEVKSLISAGTTGFLNHMAERNSLLGEKGTKMEITINHKPFEIYHNNYSLYNVVNKEISYQNLKDSIVYLNMGVISMRDIYTIMPELEKCRAIICDARGYPNRNHDLITHLLKSDDTTKAWMQIPQIVYPDHEKIVGFEKHDWTMGMKAKAPYLGDKKIVYIIDGSAISYAESCLGYIEGYKLATIVGQPSAGTNGDITQFSLPGGYMITFTGLKVLKHNGTQHHGIGILPHIYVNKTIKGIKEGRDEFLEQAIEVAKQK